MLSFAYDHGVSLVIGVIGIVIGLGGLYYARRQTRMAIEKAVSINKFLKVYLSRDEMVADLLGMYSKAESGDVIWGQCVNCSGYSASVQHNVLDAAARGVKFRIIINSNAPRKAELSSIYEAVRAAELIERSDNTLSVQGLSDQEVVVSFPTIGNYNAISLRHPVIVNVMRQWFEERFKPE